MEKASHDIIEVGAEEGLGSGHFAPHQLHASFEAAELHSLVDDVGDLGNAGARAWGDSAQGGAIREIALTMKPSYPGLSDAMRVLDIPGRSGRNSTQEWRIGAP